MFVQASMSKQSFSSFDFFFKVFGYYARKMEISINSEISKGILQKKKKRFYNYIILRSGSLYKLILHFYTHELDRDGFDISWIFFILSKVLFIWVKAVGLEAFRTVRMLKN